MSRYRLVLKWATATAMAAAASLAIVDGSFAGAPDAAAAVYLSQATPVLADAQANLDSLQFYLPLGSSIDANDPTWNTAELATEALQGDADALKILAPPDSYSATNADLVSSLSRAAASAEKAIDSLSSGETDAGNAALATLDDSTQTFNSLVSQIPPLP
jgi:hypothetical protein